MLWIIFKSNELMRYKKLKYFVGFYVGFVSCMKIYVKIMELFENDYNVLNQPENNTISGHHIYSKPSPLKFSTNFKTFNFCSFHKFISKLKLKFCSILSHTWVLLYSSNIRIRFSCIHIQCTCILLIPMTILNGYQFLFQIKNKRNRQFSRKIQKRSMFSHLFCIIKVTSCLN